MRNQVILTKPGFFLQNKTLVTPDDIPMAETWHVVKRPTGTCEIIPSNEATEANNPEIIDKWGPFDSKGEAIARRVGLIRAGKCKPL
jgi:hypothetical protein